IAKLGGFLGRRQDGDPGVKVLWRGMKRLNDISQAYLIFNRDVGNE
ncbi:MAG TPA: IS4 family transposase, partial [Anaerolineae bacterium]|nr:IS4 family transposase [Anaerolineae bacterium]HZD60262.1 IS4 family transposase [Anaerolineae bacterium]